MTSRDDFFIEMQKSAAAASPAPKPKPPVRALQRVFEDQEKFPGHVLVYSEDVEVLARWAFTSHAMRQAWRVRRDTLMHHNILKPTEHYLVFDDEPFDYGQRDPQTILYNAAGLRILLRFDNGTRMPLFEELLAEVEQKQALVSDLHKIVRTAAAAADANGRIPMGASTPLASPPPTKTRAPPPPPPLKPHNTDVRAPLAAPPVVPPPPPAAPSTIAAANAASSMTLSAAGPPSPPSHSATSDRDLTVAAEATGVEEEQQPAARVANGGGGGAAADASIYQIDKIVQWDKGTYDAKLDAWRPKAFVQWKGFGKEQDRWVPLDDLFAGEPNAVQLRKEKARKLFTGKWKKKRKIAVGADTVLKS